MATFSKLCLAATLSHTQSQFYSSDPAWPPSRSSLLVPCTLFENLSKPHDCVRTCPCSLFSHHPFLLLVLLQVTQLQPYSSQAHPHPPGTGSSVHTSFQSPVLSASVIQAIADGFVLGLEPLLSCCLGLSLHSSTVSTPPFALSRSFRFAVFFLPQEPGSHH